MKSFHSIFDTIDIVVNIIYSRFYVIQPMYCAYAYGNPVLNIKIDFAFFDRY
jgi:hypothetical protein